MSIKSLNSKVFAVAATLVLAGAAGPAATLWAGAATPSCGSSCADIFSRGYGTHHHAAFVLDVWSEGARIGQPVVMFRASHSDPAEDFTVAFQGQRTCAKHFPDDFAYEIEYAPYGVDSGLCVGTASTAIEDTPVSLRPCGASATTVWVVDVTPSTGRSFTDRYVPLINGSGANVSDPFVLTYPKNGFPTDTPRPQLVTHKVQQFSDGFGPGRAVYANQEWGADLGPLS